MAKRQPGCTGKKRHPNAGSAKAAKRKIGNACLNVYACRHCGGWHLGNSNKPHRRIDRIGRLLEEARERDLLIKSRQKQVDQWPGV